MRDEVDFLQQISIKVSNKLILWFLWRWSSISKVLKIASLKCLHSISEKNLDMKLNFCMQHADEHQRFLRFQSFQGWFQYFGHKVSFKVILPLLMGIIKHSQSSIQSNKFAISLQYLKKEVRDGVYFLHADNHQSLYKLALSFFMEVARHVQSTRTCRYCFCILLWCKTFTYFMGSGHVYCYLFPVNFLYLY